MVMIFSTLLASGASLPKMRVSSSVVTEPYLMRLLNPSGRSRRTSPVNPWVSGRLVPSRVYSTAAKG